MGDLPAGWLNISLIEIAELIMGQSPPSSSYNIEGRGLPFFQGKAEFQSLYPKVIKYCDHPTKIAQTDDILLSVRAPVGPTNLCPDTSCIGRGLAAIRPKPITGHRYLLQYFRFIEPLLSQQGTGSTFQAISKKDVESIEVLLAPLNEQCRIVTKLEKLLAKVDACKERLEKIPAILKRFRQSVLTSACSGRLTADWCASTKEHSPLKNNGAIEIDQGTLPVELSALPDTWIYAALGAVIDSIKYGTSKRLNSQGVGVATLRIPNVVKGFVDLSELKYAEFSKHEYAELFLKTGDILIVRSNGSVSLVGKCAIITKEALGFAYAGYLIRIRFLLHKVDPYFAHIALSSDFIRIQIELPARSTSGVHNINSEEVKKLVIPVPPIEEQHEIVRRVEALFKIAADIEKRYKKAKAHVDKLTQSILAKAFRGELVPQDPNDEPASELLKRIQEERKKEGPEGRPDRRGSKRRVNTINPAE